MRFPIPGMNRHSSFSIICILCEKTNLFQEHKSYWAETADMGIVLECTAVSAVRSGIRLRKRSPLISHHGRAWKSLPDNIVDDDISIYSTAHSMQPPG